MINRIREAIQKNKCVLAAEIRRHSDMNRAIEMGADFALLYHTNYLEIAKIGGLLPFGNPNEIMPKFLRELHPITNQIPLVVGVCGTEPLRNLNSYIQWLNNNGITCIQNFPSVGIIDGNYRETIESIKLGYARECNLIQSCCNLGVFCLPFAFTVDQAMAMANIGVDVIIYHMNARMIASPNETTESEFNAFWASAEQTAFKVKRQYPRIHVLIYTENGHYIDEIFTKLSQEGTAVDGVFHCVSMKKDQGGTL